jgi:hypothetical protein
LSAVERERRIEVISLYAASDFRHKGL